MLGRTSLLAVCGVIAPATPACSEPDRAIWLVPGVHEGQRATVDLTKIADWAYIKGGKSFGQFTTRVLLDAADAEQRSEIAESLAPTPLEPETK